MDNESFFKRKKLPTVLTLLLVVICAVGAYKFYAMIDDRHIIKTVTEQTNWLENFYTLNNRYPNVKEFYNRYSDEKRVYSYTPNYAAYDRDGGSDYNDAQNFTLMYTLHNENQRGTPGKKVNYDMFGAYYYTKITPCERWQKLSGSLPGAHFQVKSEMGNFYYNLEADFDKGTIAIVVNNVSKIILKDLKQPRFLYPKQDSGYNENSVLIVNVSEVMKYTWSEASGGTLTNAEKVADVPTTCSII